jgi:hypothetical protein
LIDMRDLFASRLDDQDGVWPYGYPMVVEDIGPYASREQVMTALALVVDEPGVWPEMAATTTLGHALTAAGLETTDFEQKVLIDLAQKLPPTTAQVIAGLILRAAQR